MKKFLALMLTAVLAVGCLAFVGCSDPEKEYTGIKKVDSIKDVKVGFITLHDSSSTYDKNFIDAAKQACAELGMTEDQYSITSNIPEDKKCYTAAKKYASQGYNLVFADSFGHEKYMLQAAKAFPDTQFCHATGTKALVEKRGNFHNAFATIYEGRYLAGVAAGMKLKELVAAGKSPKVGYVGAFPYAEVKSGYTAWFLGVRSIVPEATMEVKFTSSWYDYEKEKSTAEALIADGCVLISQHADSMGAPEACMAAGVPNVSYNVDTRSMTKDGKIDDSYIIASKVNWVPYFKYMITCLLKGEEIAENWIGTLETGSVEILGLNEKAAAEGTAEKLKEVEAQLKAGTLKVFDCSTFTVGGKTLTEYQADVKDMGDYAPDTNVIKTATIGEKTITYFAESDPDFRSAPYFDIDIDGITLPKN